jgi:hypothetical protein
MTTIFQGENGASDLSPALLSACRCEGIYFPRRVHLDSSVRCYCTTCTGTQLADVAYKSPSTQLAKFLNFIDSNNMQLWYLWFDIEPTSGTCNVWNLGASANTALAQQWVSLLQGSGRNWGIYANG